MAPLLDWIVGDPTPAGHIIVNGGNGGPRETTSMEGSSWAIPYVQADDVNAAIARALPLGASIALAFVDNDSIGFAHLLDPRGNRFGAWRPKQSE